MRHVWWWNLVDEFSSSPTSTRSSPSHLHFHPLFFIQQAFASKHAFILLHFDIIFTFIQFLHPIFYALKTLSSSSFFIIFTSTQIFFAGQHVYNLHLDFHPVFFLLPPLCFLLGNLLTFSIILIPSLYFFNQYIFGNKLTFFISFILKSFSSFIFFIQFVGLETSLFFHHLHFEIIIMIKCLHPIYSVM